MKLVKDNLCDKLPNYYKIVGKAILTSLNSHLQPHLPGEVEPPNEKNGKRRIRPSGRRLNTRSFIRCISCLDKLASPLHMRISSKSKLIKMSRSIFILVSVCEFEKNHIYFTSFSTKSY